MLEPSSAQRKLAATLIESISVAMAKGASPGSRDEAMALLKESEASISCIIVLRIADELVLSVSSVPPSWSWSS